MSTIKNIKVFSTSAYPCSYLEDRDATTLFVDPRQQITREVYSQLNNLGFRRSGKHLYLPHCESCQECIATRIIVDEFEPTRRQQRIQRKNADLELTQTEDISSDEHYELYRRYIEIRHPQGDMYPPSREQYLQFIGESTDFSRYLEMRLDGQLLCISVLDQLEDGLSAIYTFFDPEQNRRSLGVYAILSTIDLARSQKQHHLYLGYWIRECQKMAYKIEYRPIELLINGNWLRLR